VCDSGGAAPSILHVEAQPAAAQVIPRRWPPLVATQRWRAWIWAWRWPPSSTATMTAGVSAGPRSGPDGPRSELGCFFIFKIPFFMSVGNDRYYKPFIFCIVQIVSVAGADTKYRFPTDTINTFCCSDTSFPRAPSNLRSPNFLMLSPKPITHIVSPSTLQIIVGDQEFFGPIQPATNPPNTDIINLASPDSVQ
jgi:hypothetical protein